MKSTAYVSTGIAPEEVWMMADEALLAFTVPEMVVKPLFCSVLVVEVSVWGTAVVQAESNITDMIK